MALGCARFFNQLIPAWQVSSWTFRVGGQELRALTYQWAKDFGERAPKLKKPNPAFVGAGSSKNLRKLGWRISPGFLFVMQTNGGGVEDSGTFKCGRAGRI